MALDENVKRNWVAIQQKHDFPVNAIGIKIKPSDTKTMQVWKDEGIAEHMKKK